MVSTPGHYKQLVQQNKRAYARARRRSAREAKKAQQKASALCTAQTRSDEDISNSRTARTANATAKEQSTTAPGDIIPIVFCKRSTEGPQTGKVGGVWMQPAKMKQGSFGFQGIFLYAISEGEIVSTPTASKTYVGNQSLATRRGTTPTITTYYKSTATMASAPNVCPITSGKIFCDPDTVNYVAQIIKAPSYSDTIPDRFNFYWNEARLTIGTGNTTNSVIRFPTADDDGSIEGITVIDVKTGNDLTSSWLQDPVGPYFSVVNARNTAGGSRAKPVGEVEWLWNDIASPQETPGTLQTPLKNVGSGFSWYTAFGAASEDDPVIMQFEDGFVDNTYVPGVPATSETVAVVQEFHLSPVADPTNFPSSYDFTDYADITFLEIQGDIYDESNFASLEYKTTTRQISVLIEEGVKVALYSAGTPSSTGASQQFVDLAMYLFALNKRLIAGTTADISSPIDTSNLQDLATFHTNLGLFFNGIIEQSVNIIDFISTMAPFFFVSFVSENGRYSLKPILPLTSGNEVDTTALTPTATFTDSEIIPGSFEKNFIEAEERKDVQVSVIFRETKAKRIGAQKSKQVRFSNVSSDARMVQFDMTDCCTTSAHAVKFAKLQLAIRKHSTHSILFNTALVTSSLTVTDIIKVQRLRKNNVGDDRSELDHYQVTSIIHGTDGTTTIEGMHFPLDSSGVAKISDDFANGSFKVI